VKRTIRLMTANLLYENGATAASLSRAIQDVRPDVLAVQELTAPLTPTLEAQFPHHFATQADIAVGMGARRPVTWRELPMPHRGAVVAALDPGHWPEFAGPVEIIAVHLRNPIGLRPRSAARDRADQIGSVERVVAASPATRHVVCGDMNATPAWPAYRRLARSLSDGIAPATGRPRRTWAPLRSGPRLLRIDHVFVSGVSVVAATALRVAGSDHHALVVDLVDRG
jgi:endonuclease/exonuclease/phosphatase (EEP) superfamily protein YafD